MKTPNNSNWTDVMLRVEFKFVVSLFLLLLAFTRYANAFNLAHELCFGAMMFSFLGDLILMNYKDVPEYFFKGKQFYAGALSFIAAHVIYAKMFCVLMNSKIVWGIGGWISLVLFAVTCVFIFVKNTKKRSKLFLSCAVIYSAVILMNLTSAINCAINLGGKYILALVGVVFFIVSDFFLLIREIKHDTPTIRKLIWIFYPLAQIFIILNV